MLIIGKVHGLLTHALLIGVLCASCNFSEAQPIGNIRFDARSAYDFTAKAVGFGERPPQSPALDRTRQWIVSQLKPTGGQLQLDTFTAQTPVGRVSMTNIILRFPGTSGKAIAITGHYDTALKPMMHFVGADDGGSSTGFLIELARLIPKVRHADDIYIVFFDGEEAFRQWSDSDSTYGSRHLAELWAEQGLLSKIRALINIDMIGDKDLDLNNDSISSASLRKLMTDCAVQLGYAKYLQKQEGAIEDDHLPFVRMGVNALDVIDLDYKYWHTGADTMDKLSVHSFQVVGDIVMNMLETLENSKS